MTTRTKEENKSSPLPTYEITNISALKKNANDRSTNMYIFNNQEYERYYNKHKQHRTTEFPRPARHYLPQTLPGIPDRKATQGSGTPAHTFSMLLFSSTAGLKEPRRAFFFVCFVDHLNQEIYFEVYFFCFEQKLYYVE